MMRLAQRVLLVVTCVGAVMAWAVSRGRAQLAWALSPIPELAARLEPGTQHLVVNGLQFEVRSGASSRSPDEVLDAIEADCAAVDAGLGALGPDVWPQEFHPSVFRLDAGHVGMVACLELGETAWSVEHLASRFSELVQTGDLASLGQVRIARVTPAGQGTHWVRVRSRGALPLAAAFPEQGDAPGADVAGLPRPRSGRRILSVSARGRGVRLVSYALASQAVPGWLAEVRARGWSLRELPSSDGARRFQALRGGAALWLGVDTDGDGASVSVTAIGS